MVPAALDVGVCPVRAANVFSDFPSRRSSDAQHGPIRGAQRARHRDGRRCVLRAAAAAAAALAASNPRYGTSHVDSPARNRSMSRDAAGRCPFRSYRGWQHDSQPDAGKATRGIAALRGASRGGLRIHEARRLTSRQRMRSARSSRVRWPFKRMKQNKTTSVQQTDLRLTEQHIHLVRSDFSTIPELLCRAHGAAHRRREAARSRLVCCLRRASAAQES